MKNLNYQNYQNYQARKKARRTANKVRDATLFVEAFEIFVNALIDDREEIIRDSAKFAHARSVLISFLCQDATGS
jgi:hypothetical protein